MKKQVSMFCDNCSCLALARFEDRYLCAGCVMQVTQGGCDSFVIAKIVPLKALHDSPKEGDFASALTDFGA